MATSSPLLCGTAWLWALITELEEVQGLDRERARAPSAENFSFA